MLVVPLVVSWLGLWLSSLPFRRLADDAHWSVRARVLFPLRVGAAVAGLFVPAAVALFVMNSWRADKTLMIEAGLVGFVACQLGTRLAVIGLKVPKAMKSLGERVRAFLLSLLSPVPLGLLLMLWTAGMDMGTTAIAIAIGGMLFGMAWSMGLCVWSCVKLGYLKPADGKTVELVEKVSRKVSVPYRRVFEIKTILANAYAFIWTRDIGVTSGALAVLPEQEMEAVMAHEFEHLKEPASARWTRHLGLIPMGLAVLAGPGMKSWGFIPGYLLLVAAFMIRKWLNKFRQRMEKAADEAGKQGEAEQGVYARALERIYEANLIPAVTDARNAAHPCLYDRVVQAGVAPGYPRPAPPDRSAVLWTAILIAVLSYGALMGLSEWLAG